VVARPRRESARQKGDGFALAGTQSKGLDDPTLRERATVASEFDPAELPHGHHAITQPSVVTAILPLVIVLLVNLAMSAFVLPSLDTRFLADEKWGGTSLAAVGGVWAVVVALVAAIVLLALNYSRLPALKETFDTGANASAVLQADRDPHPDSISRPALAMGFSKLAPPDAITAVTGLRPATAGLRLARSG
jgi:hypothetical protein